MKLTPRMRVFLSVALLLITSAVVIRYLIQHPEVIDQIRATDPITIASLLLLYLCTTGALSIVLFAQLKLYGKTMLWRDNLLLNAYTALINFFGPGQSGPGFRAIYLKKKLQVGLKQYFFVTLIYYAFFAIISAFFVAVGSRPWWQTVLAVCAAAFVSFTVLKYFLFRQSNNQFKLQKIQFIGILFAGVLLQLTLQVIIYYVELHSLDKSISLAQTVTYTGAANFALFVSLTPGAIGIRESFLVFSQRLHHIDTQTIVAANVIDRTIYLLLLGILLTCVISLHAQKRLIAHTKTEQQK